MSRNISSIIVFTIIFTITAYNVSFADSDYQVGTRGEAIGFAFSALADEPFGVLYNPAGPAFSRGLQAQVGYQVPTQYGLSSIDESPYGLMMGVNYNAPTMGIFSFTSHRYGSFADPSLVPTTNAVNFSYAHPLGRSVAAGLGVKYLFESDFEKRNAVDFDLGVKFIPSENFSFAGVVENASRAEYNSDLVYAHLTRKVRIAGAYHHQFDQHIGTFLIGNQVSQNDGEDTEFTNLVNIGTEWWFAAYSDISLGARGGYTFGKLQQSSSLDDEDYSRWGLGFSLNFNMHGNDFRIDYGVRSYPYESDESLAIDQFVTLSYGWGGVPDYFAGKETEEEKYDLTKYQKSEDWQTPQSVEDLREPEPIVEKPEVVISPQTEKEKPVEVAKQPESEINVPVGIPQPTEHKPIVPADQPAPVNLTLIETPVTETKPEPPVVEQSTPVTITEPEAIESEAIEPEVVEPVTEPERPIPPVNLTIIDNRIIAAEPPEMEPAPEVKQPQPQSQPLEVPAVGSPAPEVNAIDTAPPAEEPLVVAQIAEPEEEQPVYQPLSTPVYDEPIEYEKLKLNLDANQLATVSGNKIIFTLKPDDIIHLKSWKLYVFAKKPKDWNEAVIDDYALAIIRGKGVTPLTVVWDGMLARGGTIQKGKYVFVVVGQDSYGSHYMTKWHKFKIK